MGLSFAEKNYSFTKNVDFPKTYKSVQYFTLVYAHEPKFGLSRLFYSLYHLPFMFSLAVVKRWALIMGKAWKWDRDQLQV